VASKFQYLQWFSIVKKQMKQTVNMLLATDKTMILVFDDSFSLIGAKICLYDAR